MQYKIEDGVPIPERPCGSGRNPKYPWAELKVGQSFFVPKSELPKKSGVRGLSPESATRKLGFKFTRRSMPCGGVRIWRVE